VHHLPGMFNNGSLMVQDDTKPFLRNFASIRHCKYSTLYQLNSFQGNWMNELVVFSRVHSEQEMSNYCAAFFYFSCREGSGFCRHFSLWNQRTTAMAPRMSAMCMGTSARHRWLIRIEYIWSHSVLRFLLRWFRGADYLWYYAGKSGLCGILDLHLLSSLEMLH